MQFKIDNFIIGNRCRPFIIAEAGINHNGEIEKALEMITVAKNAGADAIKFQTFKAEEIMADNKQTYSYKSQGKEITESMLDMFKRYQLDNNDWIQIKKKCDDEGILFLSTPQNKTDLDLLLDIGIHVIKVGSDDFTNIPLLKDFVKTKLPMLVSCGMANEAEIFKSLDAIGTFNGYPTVLLLAISQYPTPPEDVNLLRLDTLAKKFPNIPLGFSDHTEGSLASSLAVALGACVFEKHFTLDHNLPGPDHWFSEDPKGLKFWIKSIKKSFTIMGKPEVKCTEMEEEMKKIARRSITAIQNINQGEKFSKSNLSLRRPGHGLSPNMIERIYGLKSIRKIKKGELIKNGDFKL